MRVAGAALLALVTLVVRLPAREPTKNDLLQATEKQLKATSEVAGPCVGCVVVSKSDRYPRPVGSAEQPGRLGGYDLKEFQKAHPTELRLAKSLDLSDPANIADHGYACGVVIDPAGLVLTPYHVIEGATKVYVHLAGGAGSYADIHAADSRHDLAVLKLLTPPPKLTAIKFAEVRLRPEDGKRPTVPTGKLVVLMANAYVTGFGIDKPNAALGSITDVRYPRTDEGDRSVNYYLFGPLLEHDAKLNAAIDGSALLNLDGELIGLTTSAARVPGGENGPRYAFPADENFRRVVEVLRRGEEVEYGFLGVHLNPEGPQALQITSVTPHGPADLAGLQGSPVPTHADFITHVNDVRIKTYEDLLHVVGSALAGNTVRLTVSRGGRSVDVPITLGKFKHNSPFIASVRPEPVFGLRIDYGSILIQQAKNARGLTGVPAGVSVRDAAHDSPAAKKLGERPERWLITHVNGTAVNTPAEFYKAVKGQKSLKLTIVDPSEPNPRPREVTIP